MAPMLARVKNGKIHTKDCFCCSDGFQKTKRVGRGKKTRKNNRQRENRTWRTDWRD